MLLAVYAAQPERSKGRRFIQDPSSIRSDYQRDRDRVVHCTAFRRLVYKTQVFLNHEGDLFRTRLTHSLEVAQLARSMARSLAINEDLVEAIALAHDLGHTPFGHAGQDALNTCMRSFGGFEHNLQSLRVVDEIEECYPDFNGLNLTFETREGILKHCSKKNATLLEVLEPSGVGLRFLNNTRPSLEAQLCNIADEVAYNAHDADDGVRSGLITIDQLGELDLFGRFKLEAVKDYPHLSAKCNERRWLYETIRRILSAQVYDLINTTQLELVALGPDCIDHVRIAPNLVKMSEGMGVQSLELKNFLLKELYRHPQVIQTMTFAEKIILDLFDFYMTLPDEMRDGYSQKFQLKSTDSSDHQDAARVVADYIAGMTDRFACHEHVRATGQNLMPTSFLS